MAGVCSRYSVIFIEHYIESEIYNVYYFKIQICMLILCKTENARNAQHALYILIMHLWHYTDRNTTKRID